MAGESLLTLHAKLNPTMQQQPAEILTRLLIFNAYS
jgi:hypothetical protein